MSALPSFLQSSRRRRAALVTAAGCTMLASAAPALSQRAGSDVRNLAVADLDIGGVPARIASNTAALKLAEVLDIRLAATGSGFAVDGPGSAVPFTLVNSGNGEERFLLAGTLAAVSGQVRGFAIDTNVNGIFDPADTMLDGATPSLLPGQALALLAVIDPSAMGPGAGLSVYARAATGSGAPGTTYVRRGDGGVDAVVGASTAEATLTFSLVPGAAPVATLEKSQVVSDRNGGSMAVRGGTIAYTLVARFQGSGAARAARVRDPIPSGTTFVPGSLSLDGTALSDAADGDAGSFDGTGIAVTLGDIAGPAVRTIRFQVKIN